MKDLLRTFLLILTAVSIISCNDMVLDEPDKVTDRFVGDMRSCKLGVETKNFVESSVVCYMIAPDGSIISRSCSHLREDNVSIFDLKVGLADGEYRLLYLEYEVLDQGGGSPLPCSTDWAAGYL